MATKISTKSTTSTAPSTSSPPSSSTSTWRKSIFSAVIGSGNNTNSSPNNQKSNNKNITGKEGDTTTKNGWRSDDDEDEDDENNPSPTGSPKRINTTSNSPKASNNIVNNSKKNIGGGGGTSSKGASKSPTSSTSIKRTGSGSGKNRQLSLLDKFNGIAGPDSDSDIILDGEHKEDDNRYNNRDDSEESKDESDMPAAFIRRQISSDSTMDIGLYDDSADDISGGEERTPSSDNIQKTRDQQRLLLRPTPSSNGISFHQSHHKRIGINGITPDNTSSMSIESVPGNTSSMSSGLRRRCLSNVSSSDNTLAVDLDLIDDSSSQCSYSPNTSYYSPSQFPSQYSSFMNTTPNGSNISPIVGNGITPIVDKSKSSSTSMIPPAIATPTTHTLHRMPSNRQNSVQTLSHNDGHIVQRALSKKILMASSSSDSDEDYFGEQSNRGSPRPSSGRVGISSRRMARIDSWTEDVDGVIMLRKISFNKENEQGKEKKFDDVPLPIGCGEDGDIDLSSTSSSSMLLDSSESSVGGTHKNSPNKQSQHSLMVSRSLSYSQTGGISSSSNTGSASLESLTESLQWLSSDNANGKVPIPVVGSTFKGVAEEEEFDDDSGSQASATVVLEQVKATPIIAPIVVVPTTPPQSTIRDKKLSFEKLTASDEKEKQKLDIKRTPSMYNANTPTLQRLRSLDDDKMSLSASSTDSEFPNMGLDHSPPSANTSGTGETLVTIVMKYDRSSVVSYQELVTLNKAKDYQGLIQKHLERYLSDDEFDQVFSMSRQQFRDLPMWKQQQLKKKAQLF